MSQKLPVNGFKWIEDLSDFDENVMKKAEKLVANLHDKNECYSHWKFKISIKHWLVLEKSNRVINKLNQKAW